MWWSVSFSFSVWILSSVNRIQLRNNNNCWASNPLSDICQYVVVCFFLFQCLDPLRVNRIKSRNKWNCWALHHQAIPVNMWWSDSFSSSVRILPPVNRIQSRNKWNCSVLDSSSILCQYVVACFFHFQCADVAACSYILNRSKKQLELLSIKHSLSVCRIFLFQHVDALPMNRIQNNWNC